MPSCHPRQRTHASRRHITITLLELQSRFWAKPLKFQVVCTQNGTAVLKLTHTRVPGMWYGVILSYVLFFYPDYGGI